MAQVRVVDMAAFGRLKRDKAGARKIARALTIPTSTAQKLMAGEHWQQRPEKVRLFNQLRGANIDPASGIPSPDELAKFGGLFDRPTRHSSPVEKDVHQVLKAAGVPSPKVREVVRRMNAANGGEIPIPERLDTATYVSMIEEKLYRALLMLDDQVIASAGPRDITQMISMLTEKRALMRGEPTAIVRNEDRGSLEKVGALLLQEMRRRGLSIEGMEKLAVETKR